MGRAGQGVDLFVHRQRIVIVAELRSQELLLPFTGNLDTVVPVDKIFIVVVKTDMFPQVLGAQFGRLQETILAGEQVGRGKTIDQAGNGIGLLKVIPFLAAAQMEKGAIFPVIDGFLGITELPLEIAVGNGSDLSDPPIRLFMAVAADPVAGKNHRLDLDSLPIPLGIENTVGVNEILLLQQLPQPPGGVDILFVQILGDFGVGRWGEEEGVFTAGGGPQAKGTGGAVEAGDVAGNGIGKGEFLRGHALFSICLFLILSDLLSGNGLFPAGQAQMVEYGYGHGQPKSNFRRHPGEPYQVPGCFGQDQKPGADCC